MSLSTAPITWDLLSMSDGEVEVGPTLGRRRGRGRFCLKLKSYLTTSQVSSPSGF